MCTPQIRPISQQDRNPIVVNVSNGAHLPNFLNVRGPFTKHREPIFTSFSTINFVITGAFKMF
uniref:Uncharacterized protein n=1 Tax=Anguilla anguilla TaxID=7936 RepID=A0A0E9RQ63_ANGAN